MHVAALGLAPHTGFRLPSTSVKITFLFPIYNIRHGLCGSLRSPNCFALHKTQAELREMDHKVDHAQALEIKLAPGAAVLWRTATWHCVGPNTSNQTRKIMHVGYHYRWLRPTDYIGQDPDLIAASSPIRRQLLGALGPESNPLGEDADFHPSSQYWIPQNWDDVPLKAWAEERTAALAPAREPL